MYSPIIVRLARAKPILNIMISDRPYILFEYQVTKITGIIMKITRNELGGFI